VQTMFSREENVTRLSQHLGLSCQPALQPTYRFPSRFFPLP